MKSGYSPEAPQRKVMINANKFIIIGIEAFGKGARVEGWVILGLPVGMDRVR